MHTMTNLLTYPISSFEFPIMMQDQSVPMSEIECYFNELVTNGIYIILPRFR